MENPTPTVDPAAPLEPPKGTLALAMSELDRYMADREVEVNMGPANDAEATRDQALGRVLAAWSTVRAAAVQSLEPPPAPKAKPKGTVAERAAKAAKDVGDAMDRLSADPSADSAVAIQVVALLGAPTLTALLIEAVDRVGDKLAVIAARAEDIGNALEGGDYPTVARSLADIARGVSR